MNDMVKKILCQMKMVDKDRLHDFYSEMEGRSTVLLEQMEL